MTEGKASRRQKKRKSLWLALSALLVVVAVLVVPPLLSVSRYKNGITHLMSATLGRPVRLSSVGVRMLPRPSFELTDLTVEEDPAYGAEPILHANTVTASIRLLSLWRGRLEIGSISVDEASLNLVRTRAGRWNLDPLFRTVASKALPGVGKADPRGPGILPSLEATNSRINVKNGAEKLPFSLLNTDVSLSQEDSGEWRIRLRGQPARTDVSLDLADTGVMRLEARGGRAPELRQMPVHLDLEWREAQLGQLARLLTGTDPGWRGNLTGDVQVDGTADAAQVKIRLRAEGVHRAEFAPATPMDFDANCAFVYHYTGRSLENLACDSPVGDGRIHFAGRLPAESGRAYFSVELSRIPVQIGLDALRTVRSGFGPGLEARGAVSGKIIYAENGASVGRSVNRSAKPHPEATEPLMGSLAVEGFQLSGGGLSTPIRLPKLVLEPVPAAPGEPPTLATTVALPAGGAQPLTIAARLKLSGYQVAVHGQVAVARARELAQVSGMGSASALNALAGEPLTVDLNAEGPWMQAQEAFAGNIAAAAANNGGEARKLSGTLVLHDANWKADYLVNHLEISQATLHLGQGKLRWDPVEFSYGPVKGSASLSVPEDDAEPQRCPPHFEVQFGDLDAAALQAAALGARERVTLLSTLIERLRPSSAPAWPLAEGTVKAQSLILGPVTLTDATASVRTTANGAVITSLDARLLGGRVHGAGTLETADKPAYTLTLDFEEISPAEVGRLLGLTLTGSAIDADGKIELSGFTRKDLAVSAKGGLHFDWRHGSVSKDPTSGPIPAVLARFDRWSGDAEIADGSITVKQNEAQRGARKRAVEVKVTLDTPPKVAFSKDPVAKR